MVKLNDLMDIGELSDMITQGYVIERQHPTLPLRILNYSAKTQHSWTWNDVTEQCRGLIVRKGGEVVARPFRKFFDLSQLKAAGITPPKDEPFVCYEKVDGSAGISYVDHDGVMHIATRGSFVSEQAIKATEMLREAERYSGLTLNPKYTHFFEIVFPSNRIVVDYGNVEELYLLAVIETETGVERPDLISGICYEMGFLRPKVYPYATMREIEDAMFDDESPKGQEGFVLKYPSGLRVKVKTDEYQHLHKLVTRVTPKRIWEHLSTGGYVKKLTHGLWSDPAAWIEQHANALQGEFLRIKAEAEADFAIAQAVLADAFWFRKMFAVWVQRHCPDTQHLLFALYDGKDPEQIDAMIWKSLKPKGDQVFRPEAA